MIWIWYGFGVVGVLLTVAAYHWRRSIDTYGSDEVSEVGRLVATDFGVFFFGALTMATLLGAQWAAGPAGRRLHQQRETEELKAAQAVGVRLGKELAAKVEGDAKALIVSLATADDRDDRRIQTILEGLGQSFGSRISIGHHEQIKPNNTPTPELGMTAALALTQAQLDAIYGQNRDCKIVVLLMDVAPDYEQSTVAARAAQGSIAVGLFTGNPYQLGVAIATRQVTFCIVPQRTFRCEEQLPEDSLDAVFERRYELITDQNITAVARQNRKLFHLVKRLD